MEVIFTLYKMHISLKCTAFIQNLFSNYGECLTK